MPFNIPSYVPQVRLPGPVEGARANPETAGLVGSTIARAGEQIAAHAQRWKQEQDIAAASETVANTAGEFGRHFYERQAQAPEGAEGFAEGFRESAMAMMSERINALPSGAQQFARNRLMGHLSSWVDSAWRYEASARREWQVRTTGRSLETFAANVRADPASLDRTLADATAAIDGSGLGPRDRTILTERMRPRLAFEAIQGLAQRDPQAAREMMNGPAGEMLDARQRAAAERLISRGRGRATRDVEVGESEANRVRIAAEDGARMSIVSQQTEYGGQGFEMLGRGELTTAWVENNRHVLSPSDYRVFRRATDATLPRGSDAREAVAELNDAIDDGDPQAFASQAARMVESGRLTPQTYARMVQQNRQAAQMHGAAGVAVRSVRDGLRPPLDGPMGTVIRDEQGSAIQEMMTWTAAHPQATPQEYQQSTATILQRARARAWERIAPNLPRPDGLGRTPDTVELTDIEGLERNVVRQMDQRQIAPSEAMRRLRVLRQWRYALPLRPTVQRGQ